ncbi:hypothetical protein [Persephonella sp.]
MRLSSEGIKPDFQENIGLRETVRLQLQSSLQNHQKDYLSGINIQDSLNGLYRHDGDERQSNLQKKQPVILTVTF